MRGLLACAALLACAPALAAEITYVADAADVRQIGNQSVPDPWDLRLSTSWEMIWISGTIAREFIDNPANPSTTCTALNSRACGPVDQLSYTRQTLVQNLEIEAGLYHDLALTVELPIVYSDTLQFSYAKGMSAANSSVDTGNDATTLVPHNFASYHQGLGSLGLGLRWGLFNDERDVSKPAWVVFLKWFNPATAHTLRFAPTSEAVPGNVGDGMHRIVVGMAFSKRIGNLGDVLVDEAIPRRGYFDPYLELSYTYPIPAQGRAISSLMPTGDFGSRSPQIGRLRGGMEFVLHEDLATGGRFVLDLGFRAAYFSEARDYAQISEPLTRATFQEQRFNVTAYLGMIAQPSQYFKLKLTGLAGYDTEHWLTNEIYGLQKADGTVELNPNYCGNTPGDICSAKNLPSIDAVGYRFRERGRLTISAYMALLLLF